MKGTGNAYIGRIKMLFVGRNGAAYCVQGSAALASDDSGGHALEQLRCDRVFSRVLVLFCKLQLGHRGLPDLAHDCMLSLCRQPLMVRGPIRDTWLFTALVFSRLKNRKRLKFKKIGSGDIN